MSEIGNRQPEIAHPKRLAFFERYLTVWVLRCMVIGVAFGTLLPGVTATLSKLEFGRGSQVNMHIGVLLWLMIYPMMLKVDFSAIGGVARRPRGLAVTLFVNWLVKPFSMVLLAWVFMQHVFAAWISPDLAKEYTAGLIILAAAPCTSMVFVWSYLTDADPAYTLVQLAVNDLIMSRPPGALIGASNFFELAVAVAITLFGPGFGAAPATVVGVLVEVPVKLSVCKVCNRGHVRGISGRSGPAERRCPIAVRAGSPPACAAAGTPGIPTVPAGPSG